MYKAKQILELVDDEQPNHTQSDIALGLMLLDSGVYNF